MHYFTSYLKKSNIITCNALPPTLVLAQYGCCRIIQVDAVH